MRLVRLSRSFRDELPRLLAQGVHFGASVVSDKHRRVVYAVENVLAANPKRPIDPVLGICAYHVHKTPFVLLYDYDDSELRVHLIIHAKADRTLIDLSTVVW
jgi:mRNA-degrading endonuclease RelE of RelBE toxin-antitoxin system